MDDDAEKARMTARLAELGEDQVKSIAALDGFPHHWRLGVNDWLRQKADARPTGAAPQPR